MVLHSSLVLLFPPLISYNRLLIHKAVETHFPDLITFSIGDQHCRRTVVAFVEACYRGEKGIQLLSRPKEAEAKEQRSSRWRTQSSQDRVANWVRLREIKNRKREIWNSPKVLNVDNLEQDGTRLKLETSENDDRMDKTKPKKHAAAIYVPPSMRSRKGVEVQEEKESIGNEPVENSQSANVEDHTHPTPSVTRESNVACVDIQDEPKKPRGRGRGRGRRKPEIQVYVPRALRESKIESSKEEPGGLSQRERKPSPVETDEKIIDEDREVEIICNTSEQQTWDMQPVELTQNVSQFSDELPTTPQQQLHNSQQLHTSPDANLHSSGPSTLLSVDTGRVDSGCDTAREEQTSDSLTFEFYDPAVIAFLPSPKQPQLKDSCDPFGNIGNQLPSHGQGVHGELHVNSPDVESEMTVQNEVPKNSSGNAGDASNVSLPMEIGNHEECSKDKVKDFASECKQESLTIEYDQNVNSSCSSVLEESKNSNKEKNRSAHSHKDKLETKQVQKKKKHETNESSSKSQKIIVKEEKSKTTRSKSLRGKESAVSSSEKQSQQEDQEEDNGDSWDALFDDDGDCLDDSALADITAHVGKVEIDKPKIDYWSYTPKEPDVNFEAFSHIVEIYDFPPEFGTHDIIGAFKDFLSQGFDIKWVDDTHAIGVFASAIAAKEALKMFHPMVKIRPMSEASKQALTKAKSCQESLQPYKARPQTTSMAARRLVAGALGMAPRVSKEIREQERNKLKAAKEKRKQDKQQKVDIWDGNFGKCAMDNE